MTAFALAVIATLLWSLNNIIDKALVQRFSAGGGIPALLIISALFPILLIPTSLVQSDFSIFIPVVQIILLLLSGVCQIAWIWSYLVALREADVTVVMPLMAFAPVFSWIFGMLFLGEFPNSSSLVACGIMVFGAFVLSFRFKEREFDGRLILLTTSSAFLIAATNALFKAGVPEEYQYWQGLLWQSSGTVLVGIFVMLFHRHSRLELERFLQNNATIGIGLNSVNEVITIIGNSLFSRAILLGQIVVVQSTEAFQPVFVFLLGSALGYWLPNHIEEDLSFDVLVRKAIGITVICIGSFLLYA